MDLRPRKRQIQSITGFTQAEDCFFLTRWFVENNFSTSEVAVCVHSTLPIPDFVDYTGYGVVVGMKIDAQVIPKRENFKYLASIIQGDGEIEDDVAHRIGAGWVKWRLASEVEKMENLLIESREQVCDSEVCKKLAKTFTRSKGRAGKPIAKWTEVQAWFQNRLVCYPSKDNSAEANQKLPDYTEGCTLNKANESSHIPKEMYKYSPDKLFTGQKDPALSDLEFEARSSKDGAWTKTKYLKCKFSDVIHEADVELRIDTLVAPKRGSFKYLESIIQEIGEIQDHIFDDKNIFLEILHQPTDNNVPPRLKDMIRNKDSWDKVGVAPMVDKMTEARLRWFGHVKRMSTNAPVRRYDIDTFITHRFLNSEEPEALVRFVGFGLGEDEWVNVRKAVRERSVALENSECNKVQVGDIILCFQEGKDEEKYLEAQVIEIQKKLHDIRGCRCLFVIRYTGDDTEETIRLRRMCVRPSILGRP
ncbi:hypothetical protein MTR67_049540 [Solanum verrucosum]|uniref:SAWADEE domain-containing protein n=1 Tax=Solanum verrucosum TaxID=315347 RepID=A0AAF0V0D5_SOLVR|nr:hypothetical protein MTR67_049540 [Solanum verrucosum]